MTSPIERFQKRIIRKKSGRTLWTQEEYESMKSNNVMCNLPFEQLRNGPGINYQPCCWSGFDTGNGPQNTNPIEFFRGEEFTALRKDMMLGEKTSRLKDSCKLCWKNESETGWSPRMQFPLDIDCLQNFDKDGRVIETDLRRL